MDQLPRSFRRERGLPLLDQNEKGGEKNIATGYHSIELLLWGQDTSATGPGDRPFTDYLTDGTGTAANQDRRATYLTLATALLLEDLESVLAEWEPGADISVGSRAVYDGSSRLEAP